MRVITAKTLEQFASRQADARKPLAEWLKTVAAAKWKNIDELRGVFPNADAVKVKSGKDVCVFNIKGNTYRLVVAIHFNRGKVYILRFMTHVEYDKNAWKGQL